MALPLLAGLAGAAGLGAGIEELVRRGKGGPGGNFLTGYPDKTQQVQRFTTNQQQLQNQSLQQALSLLSGNNSQLGQNLFAPIAGRARTNFATKTIPSLAERFTSLGDSQRSSAFQGSLGEAASGLDQGLAGLESGNTLQLLQLLLGLGMQPSFDTTYTAPQQGLLHALAPAAGQAALLAFGAPPGLGDYSGYGNLFQLLSSLQSPRNMQQPSAIQQQNAQSANRLGGA